MTRRVTASRRARALAAFLFAGALTCVFPAAASAAPAREPAAVDHPGAGGIPSFYTPPRALPPAPPGTVIRYQRVTQIPQVPNGATVWRVLFHSRSIYGHDIAESGYIAVPSAPPPPGGYPVLTWAHGTSGFAGICAPSLFTTRGSGIYLIPGLATYLHDGFVVAATDYQGLGTPGIHPYLLGQSEGQGVLDAARAAMRLPGLRVADKVLIYGHSEGGDAALFAGQLAPTYAPELHVLGVVAAAPATSLSTIMTVAVTPSGGGILQFSVPTAYTWVRTYRDLPAHDLFTAAGLRVAQQYVPVDCARGLVPAIAARGLTPTTIFVPGALANPVVAAHVRENDPGRVRTRAPVLVVQGTADTTVPPGLTDTFIRSAGCTVGDTLEYVHVTGATHGTVVITATSLISRWMMDRLDGAPPPSTCGKPGDMTTYTR
jgi:alpha-beta hydrolase superfamily lysophospholipase